MVSRGADADRPSARSGYDLSRRARTTKGRPVIYHIVPYVPPGGDAPANRLSRARGGTGWTKLQRDRRMGK